MVPSRLLPHWMWWSRNESGLPGSSDSSQRLTLHSSTAIGLMSTPKMQCPITSRSACCAGHPGPAPHRPCERRASRLPMRWAAAIRKCPLPQAGSQTFRSRMACSRLLGGRLLGRLVDHRVERRIEQAVDQAGRGVVAAGRLAFVPGGRAQLERAGVLVDLRVQFQERLVDAAKLLGAEVLVVHRTKHVAVDGEGQLADGCKQVGIGNMATNQISNGVFRPKQASQCRQRQLGTAVIGAEFLHNDDQPVVEVAVPGAPMPLGQPANSGRRVVQGVTFLGVSASAFGSNSSPRSSATKRNSSR